MVLSAGKLKMGQGMEYKINDIFLGLILGCVLNYFCILLETGCRRGGGEEQASTYH